MSFAEQLDAVRAEGSSRIPEDKRAIIGQATADLWASVILDGCQRWAIRSLTFPCKTHRESKFIRPTCCRKARSS